MKCCKIHIQKIACRRLSLDTDNEIKRTMNNQKTCFLTKDSFIVDLLDHKPQTSRKGTDQNVKVKKEWHPCSRLMFRYGCNDWNVNLSISEKKINQNLRQKDFTYVLSNYFLNAVINLWWWYMCNFWGGGHSHINRTAVLVIPFRG